MSNEKKVVRLERSGPAETGLADMQLDPAGFQSTLPNQQIHVYYSDETLGLEVGVWTTTSMQEAFGPYPGDEFMWVLEGNVSMVDADGKETPVKQGESFCIRNAIPISWKQVGFLRKFFMTYANPEAPTPKIESAEGGVRILNPIDLSAGLTEMDTTDPFVIEGEVPLQRDHIAFTNDAGNMFVGMWDSTPFESEMKPFPCHELVQLLEGEVTIVEQDGQAHNFRSGDCFFIPMGTVCQWRTTVYIKKLYSILEPVAAQ
jgi:uncharacterized cupin superfamily protein